MINTYFFCFTVLISKIKTKKYFVLIIIYIVKKFHTNAVQKHNFKPRTSVGL